MRWQGGRESDNVEDERAVSPQQMMVGGGLGTIVIVILGLLFGADPAQLMRIVQQAQVAQPANPGDGGPERPLTPEEVEIGKFVKVVLADTEDVWTEIFAGMGRQYVTPKLRLFSGRTKSLCGMADSAVGPFYCPADQKVYLDTAFFNELSDRFGAPGEFARAYVIAHEVGHHVQNQLGISDKFDAMRSQLSKVEYNKQSVRLELQADFFAGVWANHANKARSILESGDVEAALNAASKIGDDALEKKAQGYVVPDSFTHGTSAQRMRWFRKGLETGDYRQGDTFSAKEL
jgi:predicted metalloprotease